MEKFKALGLSDEIVEALEKKGFEEPTPIQTSTIPVILASDRDFVGQAQTGTGKTAAFGLPVIDQLEDSQKLPQCIILTPTRELALQVSEELNSYKGRKKIFILPVYGGASIERQSKMLEKGVDIVVGTPGRVLDHINSRRLKLSNIKFFVLDEADEMLNMGFRDDIEEILKHANPERRTFLFSATMPKEIMDLARNYMKEFDTIQIAKKDLTTSLTEQIYFEVPGYQKFEALCRILDFEQEFYGIIFCRTKLEVDEVSTHLTDRGYDADALHGDISQALREKILKRFKTKTLNILVATDVAARGIDVHNLTHVINYSIPQDPESYIHRIGRTGRAGNQGTAITFVTPNEMRGLMAIKRAAKAEIRKEDLPKVKDIIKLKSKKIHAQLEEELAKDVTSGFRKMGEKLLEAVPDPVQLVSALLQFHYKSELDSSSYQEIGGGSGSAGFERTRLFIAIGKKDGITKRGLAEMIKDKSGVHPSAILDIFLLDAYSFVTVPFAEAEKIIQGFHKHSDGRKPMIEIAKPREGEGGGRGRERRDTGRFEGGRPARNDRRDERRDDRRDSGRERSGRGEKSGGRDYRDDKPRDKKRSYDNIEKDTRGAKGESGTRLKKYERMNQQPAAKPAAKKATGKKPTGKASASDDKSPKAEGLVAKLIKRLNKNENE